eukprot:COSAG01_NODE_33789_length_558_cov_1.686275_1_plen_70_part_10
MADDPCDHTTLRPAPELVLRITGRTPRPPTVVAVAEAATVGSGLDANWSLQVRIIAGPALESEPAPKTAA